MKSRRKISEANELQLFLTLSGKQVLTMPLWGEAKGQGQFCVGKICNIHIILKVGILPVCAWVSRGHPWWLSIQGTNQLFGHLHSLGSRAKEDQKGFEGFHSRMFVCVSKEGHQMSACLKEPGLSCSSPQTMSLMSFCVWYWSRLIWPHRDRTSWDTEVGTAPKAEVQPSALQSQERQFFPFSCCLVRDAVFSSAQGLVATAWKFVSSPRLWVNHWNSYKEHWNIKLLGKRKVN